MGTFSKLPSFLLPTRARYSVLAFACSLALLTYLDRICIMQAKESIQTDLGFSDKEMGLVFSAFHYRLFAAGGAGRLDGRSLGIAARLGRHCTGLVAVYRFDRLRLAFHAGQRRANSHLGSLAIPLALNSLALLLLIRFLFGLGEAGGFPQCDAHAPRLVPR